MNDKLSFAIDDMRVIDESSDSQFATLKIDAFASGKNRHDLYISEDTLKRTASTILQKPIVWVYSKVWDDAKSHDADEEVPCGFIPHDSPIEFRILEDGRTMMSIIGKLWKRYSGKMMDIFERDKSKSVSVEMEVLDSDENAEFGMEEIKNYCYQCITVLGSMVQPAIPGAKADLIAFATKEKQDYEKALEEFSNKYGDIDFLIPKEVKSNATKGLDLYKELGYGGTSISLAVGRHLVKNSTVSIDKIKSIHKFLDSHKNVPKNKNNPDGAYVSWMLHGGNHAVEWSNKMVSAISEIDNKQLAYFEDGEILTFPYKSTADANPALRGIDPPLSLGQMNEIARQADAIGGEYAWPTAIASFKKRHKVENGHWIKKESMSEKEELSVDEKELEKKEEMAVEEPKAEEKEPEKKEEMAAEEPKKEESPEEEKKESPEEEKKEDPKEEKMSLDSNLDMAAYLGFLENATEVSEEMAAKYHQGEEFNHSAIHEAAYAKMCKMAEDLKKAQEDKDAYMAEYAELKKFKEDTEKQKFEFEVEAVFAEVIDSMPKEEVDKFREETKNYSLANVDELKNKIKAVAFSYSKGKKPDDGITRIDLSWVHKKQDNDISNGWVK